MASQAEQVGVWVEGPQKARKIEMAEVSRNGTITATARALEDADFCGCIVEGRPCIHAMKIVRDGVDPSTAVLMCACKKHKQPAITIEEAMNCTNQT